MLTFDPFTLLPIDVQWFHHLTMTIRQRSDHIGLFTPVTGPNNRNSNSLLCQHTIYVTKILRDKKNKNKNMCFLCSFTDNKFLYMWSHVCCFSFKLSILFWVLAQEAVWISRICLDQLLRWIIQLCNHFSGEFGTLFYYHISTHSV